ncbi:MAG: ATP-dependent RNA helicase HrpA [Candidatus Aminicenantes bacterium RBG_16_63_16]|nr:MAG: ATP-dependent RNA helicase HrpA [Candidatus Aminicenantes bacterium RBG_16_63_16]
MTTLEAHLRQSAAEHDARRRSRPQVRVPPALPIAAKRHEIVEAIRRHPVLIISGETGCGKSTQIPKMCLEAGRGVSGMIACTQPRRIAAVTIAHRIAEELREPLGRTVGYKIRFQDRTPREAYIKIMTDGMLLAETQSDHNLLEYDTLIIDEAHERSLNIDFLLGLARTLLPARPELKVIITSATLDTEKFIEAFNHPPVIHVGGRLYPVEVEHMPPESFSRDMDESDYVEMAVRAVERLKSRRQPGDILIFMPTEQDILEACERLGGKHYAGTSILPLYARLPAHEQGRVYSVTGPKIVVATNVAETSLTIPGIRYVIDTGLARISHYQPGTRIHSLPISPISQASADQRKGRCGRVQEGLCLRLYSREDYESRPRFTPPEILRSNLAEVILRMIYLRLGDPNAFPFVDRPNPKNVKDGYEALRELGAATGSGRDADLTPLGRRMAPIPLDPRISRMLLEAHREKCVEEVTVISSALSIRDPRERPPDKANLADQAQAVFSHPDSDFLTLLNIWRQYHGAPGSPLSASRQRKFCHDHFLSHGRMREWGFVHDQILSILEEQGLPAGPAERREISPPVYAAIHRSILTGFLSNIAVHKEKSVYQAAKGREVMLFPGSTLFGKARPWIVAAEVVRTSRLYARMAAKIDPAWLEELGGDECRYAYSEPRWDIDRGEVRAKERVTLYGLEIIKDRDVAYGPKNPDEAHKIFVARALVEGRVKDPPEFLKLNLALQSKAAGFEEKLRRRNIMVDERTIAEFYSRRLAGVFDLRGLEKRIQKMGNDGFLRMSEKDVWLAPPDPAELALYPDSFAVGDKRFRADYRFSPGAEEDGLTIRIPSPEFAAIPDAAFEWGPPGYFRDKVEALLKALPKNTRKQLQPIAHTVDVIAREMKPTSLSLFESLAAFVRSRFGLDVPARDWAKADIPSYLKTRLVLTDHAGKEIASGRDPAAMRRAAAPSAMPEDAPEWQEARRQWERTGIRSWDFDELPETVKVGHFLVGYLGLEAGERGVDIRLFRDKEEARASHERGVEALLAAKFAKDTDFLRRYLLIPEEHVKAALYFGGKPALEKKMQEKVRAELFRRNIRTRRDFEAHAASLNRAMAETSHSLHETTMRILDAYRQTREALQAIKKPAGSNRALATLAQEVRTELDEIVPADFMDHHPLERLKELPRYISSLWVRVQRGRNDPEKDRKKAEEAQPFAQALAKLEKRAAGAPPDLRRAVEELRWMLEEFKVSVFAPELKTAYPVSAKRLAQKIKEINDLFRP